MDVGTQAVTVSPVESVRVSLWPSTVTIAQFWPAAGAWLPPAGGFARDDWARVGETLADLATDCALLGVRVAFHPHAGTYVETGAEVDALMAAVRDVSVGLCLDTGHLLYGGADPVAVARTYSDRIWHVHAKDVRAKRLADARRETTDYSTAVGRGVFAPLGDGSIDFPALAATLRRGFRAA